MTAKSKNTKNSKAKNGGVPLTGDGKFPLVPIEKIEIVERPKLGEETKKLFYNPRDLESFNPESMAELRLSIRTDGLQTPPLVRAFTEGGKGDKNSPVLKVELIAGERRLRSLQFIVENDLPVFDEDAKQLAEYDIGQTVISKGHFGQVVSIDEDDKATLQLLDCDNNLTDEQRQFAIADIWPAVSGADFYSKVACRVAFDISDARALRLAFTENDKAKSLSTKEEIALVERLSGMNLKVAEITEMLGSNDTWVSQTANFRTQLPKEAFELLLNGKMRRHVAVDIMRFVKEDRPELVKETIKAEKEDTAQKRKKAEDEIVHNEDEEILALSDKKKAAAAGDTKGASKAARKAAGAASKAEKARKKKERVESEAGQIKTSHIQKAAAKTGLNPKKAKMLPIEEIKELFITEMKEHLEGESIDPICGETIPADYAAIVIATATAIISGNRDPLSGIRQFMIEEERWEVTKSRRDDDDDDDDDDDGPSDEDLAELGYECDEPDEADFAAVIPSRRGRGRKMDDHDF